jgi:ABC-type nitrate/sulfonate/bicarbonate transport system substrate-binding protein
MERGEIVRLIVVAVLVAIVVGTSVWYLKPTPTPTLKQKLKWRSVATNGVPIQVAIREGWFEQAGIDIDFKVVGDDVAIFRLGEADIIAINPVEVVNLINDGYNCCILSASGLTLINGLFVLKGSPYYSIQDLIGKTIGQPGWGTGTTQNFLIVMKMLYNIDAKASFNWVVADSAALVSQLDKGQIDAALLFTSWTLGCLAQPEKYRQIFNFYDPLVEKYGQPLRISVPVAMKDFVEKNKDLVRKAIEIWERGVKYIIEHPDEFLTPNGKYYDLGTTLGWTKTPAIAQLVKTYLQSGKLWSYAPYTNEWIEFNYKYLREAYEMGFIKSLPSKDVIFRPIGGL